MTRTAPPWKRFRHFIWTCLSNWNASRVASGIGTLFGRAHDFEQLDLEDQRSAAGNPRPPLISVGQARRTNQHRLAAGLHLLNALGPAGDHPVQSELGGLISLI